MPGIVEENENNLAYFGVQNSVVWTEIGGISWVCP